MNKLMLRFSIFLLQYLGAFIGAGDLEDEIISDLEESGVSAKVLESIPPAPDTPPVEPGDDDLPPETKPKPQPKPKDEDYLPKFNAAFGTEFKSVDEILNSDIPTRVKSYGDVSAVARAKEEESTRLATRIAQLEAQLDPLSHFANEGEYIRQQLLKKHPEYDPTVLSRVVSKDLDKMDPVDILTMSYRLENGDIFENDREAREAIMAKFELSEDTKIEDLDPLKRNEIKLAAKEARLKMSALQKEVTLPTKEQVGAELQAKQEALAKVWEPFVSGQLLDQLKKIEFKSKEGTSEFVFEVEDAFIQSVQKAKDVIIKDLAAKGYEVTPERQQGVVNAFLKAYKAANVERIARAYAADMVQKMDEATFKEIHNPRPLRRDSRPAVPGEKERLAASKAKAEAEIEADL